MQKFLHVKISMKLPASNVGIRNKLIKKHVEEKDDYGLITAVIPNYVDLHELTLN